MKQHIKTDNNIDIKETEKKKIINTDSLNKTPKIIKNKEKPYVPHYR